MYITIFNRKLHRLSLSYGRPLYLSISKNYLLLKKLISYSRKNLRRELRKNGFQGLVLSNLF